MMYKIHTLRPAMTAIAAALALSSTSAFAQATDSSVPAASAAPMVAPPPPSTTSAVPTSLAPATAAPAPLVNVPPASVSNAPAADSSTMSASTQTEEPAATSATKAGARNADKAARSAAVAKKEAAKASATASALNREPSAPPPLPATPAAAPLAEPAPAPVAAAPAPAPVTPQPVAQAPANDDILPIAGGIVGLGAIATIGGAFMLRRRRKEAKWDDASDAIVATHVAEPAQPVRVEPIAPVIAPAAGFTAQPVTAQSAALDGPVTRLPAGFDLSRYGPHVQAAYRGPTENNPSLSLKTRLKRARAFDQRERMGLAPIPGQVNMQQRKPVETVRAAPAANRSTKPLFQFNWPKTNTPAFQG